MHNNSTLKLDRIEIPVIDQFKFLRIIFGKKAHLHLSFSIPKIKCNKILKVNLLITHTEWDTDQQTFMKTMQNPNPFEH